MLSYLILSYLMLSYLINAGGVDHDQQKGDFPLSTVLLERRMSIGRVALNVASLALPRLTQADGEVLA